MKGLLIVVVVLLCVVPAGFVESAETLGSLAAILRERYDSTHDLHYTYRHSGELLEPGIVKRMDPSFIFPGEKDRQFSEQTMWLTRGKIRSDVRQGPSRHELAMHRRAAWNGKTRLNANLPGNLGTVSSDFVHGQMVGMDPFVTSGFMLRRVTGYYDPGKLSTAGGKGLCPLAKIQDELQRRSEGKGSDFITVGEQMVNGRRLVVFQEQYPGRKNPRWQYLLDPARGYSVVRLTHWANEGASDVKTSETVVEVQEADGHFVPKEVAITYYGAYYAAFEPELADTSLYDKPVQTRKMTLDDVKINKGIDASVFEAPAIFEDGMLIVQQDTDVSYRWGQADVEETAEQLAAEMAEMVPVAVEEEPAAPATGLRSAQTAGTEPPTSTATSPAATGSPPLTYLLPTLAAVLAALGVWYFLRRRGAGGAPAVVGLMVPMLLLGLSRSVAADEQLLAFQSKTVELGGVPASELTAADIEFRFTNAAEVDVLIEDVLPSCRSGVSAKRQRP